MISSFDHIALPMREVAAMLRFYQDLGCEVIPQNDGLLYSVIFGNNKINFHTPSLWQSERFTLRAPAASPGCGDLCFVWQGNQQELLDCLSTAEAEIEEGPVQRTGGMNRGSTRGSSIYTRDPDGNLLEFIIYG